MKVQARRALAFTALAAAVFAVLTALGWPVPRERAVEPVRPEEHHAQPLMPWERLHPLPELAPPPPPPAPEV